MTVINQNSTVTANGNGVTTEWPYTFNIPDAASARVGLFTIATSTLVEIDPADYSITGLGDDAGGEVTYPLVGAPIASTHRLVIWREIEYTQDTDLTNQTPYYPEVLETQLDRIVMQVQQIAEETSRSIKVSLGSTSTPDELLSDIADAVVGAETAATTATAQAVIATAQAVLATAQVPLAEAEADAAAASAAAALVSENAVALAAVPVGMVTMQNGAVDAGYLRMGEGGSYDRGVYPDLAAWMDINGETAFGLSAGDVATGVLPDWRDYAVRTAGGALGPAVGVKQEDAFQGHHHDIWDSSSSLVSSVIANGSMSGTGGVVGLQVAAGTRFWAGPPKTDGTNGVPRTATETRVKSFGVRWQIKAYGALVNSGTADLVAIENAQQFMVRHDAQVLSQTQKGQVAVNIGMGWERIGDEIDISVATASIPIIDLVNYRMLRLVGFLVPVTDSVNFLVQTSIDNGGAYTTGAGDYSYQVLNSGGATTASGGGTIAGLRLSTDNIGNAAGEGVLFEMIIAQFNKAAHSLYNTKSTVYDPTTSITLGSAGGRRGVAEVNNALRILASSGNIASGYVTIEGIRG